MIYLAVASVFVLALFILWGGVILFLKGFEYKEFLSLIIGFLMLVSLFALGLYISDQDPRWREHCGVGTEYVPEVNGHDWYCKADKD